MTTEPDERIRRTAELDWTEYVQSPWYVQGMSLPELFSKRGFSLVDVSASGAPGSEAVTAKFTYAPSDEELKQRRGNPWSKLRGGTLVLSPHESWSLVQSEFVTDEGMRIETEIEYGDRLSKFLMPRHVKRAVTTPRFVHRLEAAFDRLVSREAPESEFTLAAFGVPEAAGIAITARTRRWLWAAVAGGALLLVAAGFGWLKRRAVR